MSDYVLASQLLACNRYPIRNLPHACQEVVGHHYPPWGCDAKSHYLSVATGVSPDATRRFCRRYPTDTCVESNLKV